MPWPQTGTIQYNAQLGITKVVQSNGLLSANPTIPIVFFPQFFTHIRILGIKWDIEYIITSRNDPVNINFLLVQLHIEKFYIFVIPTSFQEPYIRNQLSGFQQSLDDKLFGQHIAKSVVYK